MNQSQQLKLYIDFKTPIETLDNLTQFKRNLEQFNTRIETEKMVTKMEKHGTN